jgi:hypothetical protein
MSNLSKIIKRLHGELFPSLSKTSGGNFFKARKKFISFVFSHLILLLKLKMFFSSTEEIVVFSLLLMTFRIFFYNKITQ